MISLVCRWYYQCGHSGEQYFPNDKKVFIDNAFVTEQLNQGRIQDFKLGGAFFWRKIVIFHMIYPKNLARPPLKLEKYDFFA
jgi:hypothetical protein